MSTAQPFCPGPSERTRSKGSNRTMGATVAHAVRLGMWNHTGSVPLATITREELSHQEPYENSTVTGSSCGPADCPT